jgi:hypothetical protein
MPRENALEANVSEGVDSVFYFEGPDCSIDVTCSVGVPEAVADTFGFIRTTVFSDGEQVGEETIPFPSDRNSYQLQDLKVYQWKQVVDFQLDASGVITLRFQFCGDESEASVDGVLRVLILFGPNPAIQR